MTINTQYIQAANQPLVKVPKFKFENSEFKSTFDFRTSMPVDKYSEESFWDDDTKAVLLQATKSMGIPSYTPTLSTNDNAAIAKSQNHLIDLLKYYEGDKDHYFEAFTTPYNDGFGNSTYGFGELGNKKISQKQAYESMCKKLVQASKEVKNVLNKRIGDGTYEALPNSIKELLIDLCYNKGLPKISSNATLMNAIKNKDYSGVIKNSVYAHSGKSDAVKTEEPGLYKRSFSRMILGLKDLQGKERDEAKVEIENLYKRAKACFIAKNKSTDELDKIYEQYKTGHISYASVSAESRKVKIDERFKGKGLYSISRTLYKEYCPNDTSFTDFMNKIKRLNKNAESIQIGQELKIPVSKNAHPNITNATLNTEKSSENVEKTKIKEEKEEKGFLSTIGSGIANFFKSIGNWICGLFGGSKSDDAKNTDEDMSLPPFKRILKKAKISQIGDLSVISYDYKIKKGDNLWNLAKEYDTNVDILANDNKITDSSKICIDQHINIQKLGYKIQKGDNLFQIAKKFGLTVDMIKDLNNIEDANQIKSGDMIEIPGYIYEAKLGDNLSSIAQKVGVKLADLMRINNLTSDALQEGQKLVIVYNDSDYSVDPSKKTVTVDNKTNTKTEVIDMSSDMELKNRPLLQQKRKINGKVAATRKEFAPTGFGKLSGKTILVNAGHGYKQSGTDKGAGGRDGVPDEWLCNYDNSMRIIERLRKNGARVIYLQGGVNVVSEEMTKANNKADMFISVHVNSYDKATQDRTQIYSSTKDNLAIHKKSRKLAQIMERKFDNWISKNEKIASKDVFTDPKTRKQDYAQEKEANYQVLRVAEGKCNTPAVLWETAFMISPKGRERLKNPKLMDSYADIMTQSVIEYFS